MVLYWCHAAHNSGGSIDFGFGGCRSLLGEQPRLNLTISADNGRLSYSIVYFFFFLTGFYCRGMISQQNGGSATSFGKVTRPREVHVFPCRLITKVSVTQLLSGAAFPAVDMNLCKVYRLPPSFFPLPMCASGCPL